MKTRPFHPNHRKHLNRSTTMEACSEAKRPTLVSRSRLAAPGSPGRMLVALIPLAALLASCVSVVLTDDSGLVAAAEEKGNCEDKIARIVEFHGKVPEEAGKLYEAARFKVNGWLASVSSQVAVRKTAEASKADFYAATQKEIDAFMNYPSSTRSVIIPGILQAVNILTGEINRLREEQVENVQRTIDRLRWEDVEDVTTKIQVMRSGDSS